MVKITVFLIDFYRFLRSHIFPVRACRFTPSCSQYMKESLLKYGFLKGLKKGVFRILRCHPFCEGGYDPVD